MSDLTEKISKNVVIDQKMLDGYKEEYARLCKPIELSMKYYEGKLDATRNILEIIAEHEEGDST